VASEQIGTNISSLRKAKGAKQEDVAKAVGVSAQAVSKWENGGTPDIELLPLIADYFGVSIDRLFNHTAQANNNIIDEVIKYVAEPIDAHGGDFGDPDETPDEAFAESMERAREICWAANLGLCGTKTFEKMGFTVKQIMYDIQKKSSGDLFLHSQITNNAGMTLTSISRKLPYSLLFIEPEHGWAAEFMELEKYRKAFAILAEPDVLECMHLIHTKEAEKKFTLGHFAKMSGLETNRAEEVLESLIEAGYVEASVLDLDDTQQKFFGIKPSHIYIMILVLMRIYIEPPVAMMQFNIRKKPYLRSKEESQ